MATSAELNIITGRTGTAHISSDDDAAIWRGIVGRNASRFISDQSLIYDLDTKGEITVSSGVFCINGRMGRVNIAKTVTYDLPASGYYRRTMLIIRYSHDTNTDTESMTLMTLQSDPADDTTSITGGADAAADLPITLTSSDAVYVDFVVDENGSVDSSVKNEFESITSLSALYDTVNLLRPTLYSGSKTGHDTSGAFFTFTESASAILGRCRMAIIEFHEAGAQTQNLTVIYYQSSSFNSKWFSIPIETTIDGSQRYVTYYMEITPSGSHHGDIRLCCNTLVNGNVIISPSSIPYDRATIIAFQYIY